MFEIDNSFTKDLADQHYEMILMQSNVPIRVIYTKEGTGNKNKFTQVVEDNIQEVKIDINCIIKQGKQVGDSENTIALSGIPLGNYGIFIPWENKLSLKSMTNNEKNSMRFYLYPDEDFPKKVKPKYSLSYVWYFNKLKDYPQLQVFICEPLGIGE